MHHQTISPTTRLDRLQKQAVIGRMVDHLRREADPDTGVTEADLRRAGFDDLEIAQCAPAAALIAGRRLEREANLSNDEAARLAVEQTPRNTAERAAELVAGLLPDVSAVHYTLKTNGYSTPEIGAMWPHIIAAAGQQFGARMEAGS